MVEAGTAPVAAILEDAIRRAAGGLSVDFSQGLSLVVGPLVAVLPNGHSAQAQGASLLLLTARSSSFWRGRLAQLDGIVVGLGGERWPKASHTDAGTAHGRQWLLGLEAISGDISISGVVHSISRDQLELLGWHLLGLGIGELGRLQK